MPDRGRLSCRFILSPMSDQFVEIVRGALGKMDTHLVKMSTEKLTATYRGQREHVEDVVKAYFIYAYRPEVHTTMEAVYSRGWPGEEELDWPETGEETPPNEAAIREIHFPAMGTVTLYALDGATGGQERLTAIAQKAGVLDGVRPDCVLLYGDIQAIFDCVEAANRAFSEDLDRYALLVNLSVNKPGAKKE